jgi:tetratricopeptide (TPR) repeat protein
LRIPWETALQRHKSRDARIIPIILRPVVWETTPIGQVQSLPTDAKPITLWADRDEAFKDVVVGIGHVVQILRIQKHIEKKIDEGNAHYYAGRYEEALVCYYNVINASSGQPGIDFRFLAHHYEKNNHELPDFNKLTSFGYRDVDLLTKIGSGLWHMRSYDGALIAFEQALSIEPNNALAWISKGIVLEGLRRSEEAQLCFKKAQELT